MDTRKSHPFLISLSEFLSLSLTHISLPSNMRPFSLNSTHGGSHSVFMGKKGREISSLNCRGIISRIGDYVVSPLLSAVLIISAPQLASPPVSFAQNVSNGAALFQKSCIGCHDMGGNILQPGATLFTKDLQRNGILTEDDLYNITYYGKGRMPGFGEKCTPRGQCTFGPRLQEEEIRILAEFVKLQADNGWPKIESLGD